MAESQQPAMPQSAVARYQLLGQAVSAARCQPQPDIKTPDGRIWVLELPKGTLTAMRLEDCVEEQGTHIWVDEEPVGTPTTLRDGVIHVRPDLGEVIDRLMPLATPATPEQGEYPQ